MLSKHSGLIFNRQFYRRIEAKKRNIQSSQVSKIVKLYKIQLIYFLSIL